MSLHELAHGIGGSRQGLDVFRRRCSKRALARRSPEHDCDEQCRVGAATTGGELRANTLDGIRVPAPEAGRSPPPNRRLRERAQVALCDSESRRRAVPAFEAQPDRAFATAREMELARENYVGA